MTSAAPIYLSSLPRIQPQLAPSTALSRPSLHDTPAHSPLQPAGSALPAMFVTPPPPPDPTIVLVTTLMLQQQEEQRREQQAKLASQHAAQQTQQRLKQQLMVQKQRMIAQQQQMKQKQLEQQQHQAAKIAAPPPSAIPPPTVLLPSAISFSVVESAPPVTNSGTPQQPAAADTLRADIDNNAAHQSPSDEEQYHSPHTPLPNSAVPQTDVAPNSPPPVPLAPIRSVPPTTTPPCTPPSTAPLMPSLPPPPLPSAVMPSTASLPHPTTAALDSVLTAPQVGSPPFLTPQLPRPPPPPSDPALRVAIDRLAEFVHRNAQFEHVIKSKHPPRAPGMFAFLYDEKCDDYQYYSCKRRELAGLESGVKGGGVGSTTDAAVRDAEKEADDEPGTMVMKRKRSRSPADSTRSTNSDIDGTPLSTSHVSESSLAAMEQYVQRLSSTDRAARRTHIPDSSSHSSQHNDTHHSADTSDPQDDYTPPDRFFSRHARHSQPSRAAIASLTKSTHIDDTNVGFRLLSKMGWKGGEGIGKDGRKGRLEPVMPHTGEQLAGSGLGRKEEKKAGNRKRKERQQRQQQFEADGGDEPSDEEGGEGEDEDGDGEGGFADVYESYKRQMSMKYQHRPNPLNNPRRQY